MNRPNLSRGATLITGLTHMLSYVPTKFPINRTLQKPCLK